MQLEDDLLYREVVECYNKIYGKDCVRCILVYGSYARGDFDLESDINIVAIVSGERRDLQEKLKIIWDETAEIGVECDIVLSPTVIPEDEFEKYYDRFLYYMNIVKEGKRID